MATCKDCVHYEACKGTYYEVKEQGEFEGEMYAECGCDDFKDKSNYVEVVRCKDCIHSKAVKHRSEDMENVFHCTYLKPNTTLWDTDYCSYGKRKEVD